jgi:hypothetical protein
MAIKRLPRDKKRPKTSVHVQIDDFLIAFVEHFRVTHRLTRSALFNLSIERAFADSLKKFKADNPHLLPASPKD